MYHRKEIWEGKVKLREDDDITFRYFTCIAVDHVGGADINGGSRDLIVRRWETNILPRSIKPGGM